MKALSGGIFRTAKAFAFDQTRHPRRMLRTQQSPRRMILAEQAEGHGKRFRWCGNNRLTRQKENAETL
jgi:hypothetical protein